MRSMSMPTETYADLRDDLGLDGDTSSGEDEDGGGTHVDGRVGVD